LGLSVMGREAYGSLLRFVGHMAQAQFMVWRFGLNRERIVALLTMSRMHSFDRGTQLPQSSRSRIRGLTESARCAGIHVANSPNKAIATTTPASTNGSRGVAW
jgi:hypothetical protein